MLTIQRVEALKAVAPWRPVQFLGSKLRSLPQIKSAVASAAQGPGVIWDAFSGSSVVSQALAADGHQVWATDALHSSSLFAASALGVKRARPSHPLVEVARQAAGSLAAHEMELWGPWLEREARDLSGGDGLDLLRLHEELPQRWRLQNASSRLDVLFKEVSNDATKGLARVDGLISATYAGTYFSLRQALDLERLRGAIEDACSDPWSRAALMTALCHAASLAVYSPGKHFAQPHRVREGKDLTFHARRALNDRSVDIVQKFLAAAELIEKIAPASDEGHWAEQRLVGDVQAEDLRTRGVTTVYADPPYTAQQYSRFYHLLETLVAGVPPVLQQVRGKVTRGLYPQGRYLSPFSSRRQAPDAFRGLIRTAREADANLVVSYSACIGTATGNARMVSLEEMCTWMVEAYGASNFMVERLDFRYRQFNNRDSEVSGRDDPEYLLIGRAHAC